MQRLPSVSRPTEVAMRLVAAMLPSSFYSRQRPATHYAPCLLRSACAHSPCSLASLSCMSSSPTSRAAACPVSPLSGKWVLPCSHGGTCAGNCTSCTLAGIFWPPSFRGRLAPGVSRQRRCPSGVLLQLRKALMAGVCISAHLDFFLCSLPLLCRDVACQLNHSGDC